MELRSARATVSPPSPLSSTRIGDVGELTRLVPSGWGSLAAATGRNGFQASIPARQASHPPPAYNGYRTGVGSALIIVKGALRLGSRNPVKSWNNRETCDEQRCGENHERGPEREAD